jgi:tetratricopeptide (TPR) repeat protein
LRDWIIPFDRTVGDLMLNEVRLLTKYARSTRWVLIQLLLLTVSIFSVPGMSLRAEDTIDPQISADLERELERLVLNGAAQSNDLNRLLRLASLYLELGKGVYDDQEEKLAAFREGARVARRAIDLLESSAEAHFLFAANLGSAAELQGLAKAALTIRQLKKHVHRALELDERHVPAHHMLGRMYEELPWFLGGNQEAAGKHLRQAVSLDGRYAPARLDLARWYMKRGQSDEALQEVIQVLEAPPLTRQWLWEGVHRPQAEALLQQIGIQKSSGRSGKLP